MREDMRPAPQKIKDDTLGASNKTHVFYLLLSSSISFYLLTKIKSQPILCFLKT